MSRAIRKIDPVRYRTLLSRTMPVVIETEEENHQLPSYQNSDHFGLSWVRHDKLKHIGHYCAFASVVFGATLDM